MTKSQFKQLSVCVPKWYRRPLPCHIIDSIISNQHMYKHLPNNGALLAGYGTTPFPRYGDCVSSATQWTGKQEQHSDNCSWTM